MSKSLQLLAIIADSAGDLDGCCGPRRVDISPCLALNNEATVLRLAVQRASRTPCYTIHQSESVPDNYGVRSILGKKKFCLFVVNLQDIGVEALQQKVLFCLLFEPTFPNGKLWALQTILRSKGVLCAAPLPRSVAPTHDFYNNVLSDYVLAKVKWLRAVKICGRNRIIRHFSNFHDLTSNTNCNACTAKANRPSPVSPSFSVLSDLPVPPGPLSPLPDIGLPDSISSLSLPSAESTANQSEEIPSFLEPNATPHLQFLSGQPEMQNSFMEPTIPTSHILSLSEQPEMQNSFMEPSLSGQPVNQAAASFYGSQPPQDNLPGS